MTEDKKQDISESQEASEMPSDYLDQIQEDTRRLSGIVDVIATLDGDDVYAHGVDFDNLAFAMKSFIYSIEDAAEELHNRLKEVGTLYTKLAPAITTGQGKEGRA